MEFIFILKIHCACDGCIKKVKGLKRSIEGLDSISIDKNQGTATISGTVDPDTVMEELAKITKKAVDLLEQIQPVPPKQQVQESSHKTHQAAKGNTPITVTLDPHTLKKEHEKEKEKAGLQQKPVKKIHAQPRKVAPQPAEGNAPITVTLDPDTLTKEHEKEKEKEKEKAGLQQKPVKKIHGQPRKEEPQPGPHTLTKENKKTGLQQKPVKKIDGRPLKEAPQPVIGFKGLDESTRKRTPNCCHNLVLKPKYKLFTCNGCKEEGIEPRYRCEDCDYDFHKVCKSPKETTTHEFFKGSTFKFLSKPDKNIRICDACGRKIYGCSYHCKAKDLDMHPCCSNLKGKLCIGGTDFILKGKVKYKCLWCNKKKRDWIAENEAPGWSYVSKEKRLCCHVHCMWQMVFEAWKKDGFHGTDDDDDTSTMALSKIDLKDLVNSNGNGGRCRVKILKSVGIVLRAIIGILLGDPTVVLTPLLVESISK